MVGQQAPYDMASREVGDFRKKQLFQMKLLVTIAISAVSFLSLTPCQAAGGRKTENPDLTNGGSIPAGAKHDWNLGATGARGWIYGWMLSTHEARQIGVTEVAKGSPADGILEKGDVILGVAGEPFSYDARVEFGKALTAAETENGRGRLSLQRWRNGKTGQVVIPLPVLGTYSATAPYNCPKSKRILEQGCAASAKRMGEPDYRGNPITRSVNALALLASGNKNYLPLVKKEAEWAAGYHSKASESWWYGYVITFLSEYAMATRDQSVMPGLRRFAMETAKGQSVVGSWSHGFVGADGRLGFYGMMNAPGIPLTISLVVARKAGASMAPPSILPSILPSIGARDSCASMRARAPFPTETMRHGCRTTRTTANAPWRRCFSTSSGSRGRRGFSPG